MNVNKKVKYGVVSAAVGVGLFAAVAAGSYEKVVINTNMMPDSLYETEVKLRTAPFYKKIDLYLHTYGGDVMSGTGFVDALQTTKANVVVHIPMGAMSMGAITACSAKNLKIDDKATIMFHTIQSMNGPVLLGKGLPYGWEKWLTQFKDLTEKNCPLTKEEVRSIFYDGTEVWLTGKEFKERRQGVYKKEYTTKTVGTDTLLEGKKRSLVPIGIPMRV